MLKTRKWIKVRRDIIREVLEPFELARLERSLYQALAADRTYIRKHASLHRASYPQKG